MVHPRNPHVPAIHMNTRMLQTSRFWLGGGMDINPALTGFPKMLIDLFHHHLKASCDRYDPQCYHRFRENCDRYFFIPHRQIPRGAGGIFFDQINSGHFDKDFHFLQDVGRTFLKVYPLLVTQTARQPWTPTQRQQQNRWRGLYAEFNLAWDRGTRFGLQTGAHPEAVLMSLPPVATW